MHVCMHETAYDTRTSRLRNTGRNHTGASLSGLHHRWFEFFVGSKGANRSFSTLNLGLSDRKTTKFNCYKHHWPYPNKYDWEESLKLLCFYTIYFSLSTIIIFAFLLHFTLFPSLVHVFHMCHRNRKVNRSSKGNVEMILFIVQCICLS